MRRHDYFHCICISPLPGSIQKLKNLFEVLEAVRTPCPIGNCFRRKGKKKKHYLGQLRKSHLRELLICLRPFVAVISTLLISAQEYLSYL